MDEEKDKKEYELLKELNEKLIEFKQERNNTISNTGEKNKEESDIQER